MDSISNINVKETNLAFEFIIIMERMKKKNNYIVNIILSYNINTKMESCYTYNLYEAILVETTMHFIHIQ